MLHLFFYETVNKYDETVYRLNTWGYIFFIVLFLMLLALAIALVSKKNRTIPTKQLVFSAVAIALATVLSEVKLFQAPMGGSVTLMSMLFVVLIGWIYGPAAGLLTGFAHGILQLLLGSSIYSLPQMLVDYPLAFAALGLSGFFSEAKEGLLKGYILGAFGRFVFAFLSGYLFFAYYAPEGMNPAVYSALYNISYIGIEAVITCIIIMLPPVHKAMEKVREMALS
ncbi:MAG: energy-coupled thiamine transporter ThiT [Lachnospiraceae bacterium]|nr:energy-coupled thiamine transporter ThiT [Lachnospiraceae bacterium]